MDNTVSVACYKKILQYALMLQIHKEIMTANPTNVPKRLKLRQ